MKDKSLQSKRELIAAVEHERRVLGGSIHDSLCQTLAGSALILDRIERDMAAQRTTSAETYVMLKNVLETAVAQARSLSQRFDPANLQGPGLMTALDRLVKEIRWGSALLICEKPVFVFNPEAALALFRVAERAFEKALAQRNPPNLEIKLEQDARETVLSVRDANNAWATLDAPPTGPADFDTVKLMRHRAESTGGTLHFQSGKDEGTLIICRVPTGEGHV